MLVPDDCASTHGLIGASSAAVQDCRIAATVGSHLGARIGYGQAALCFGHLTRSDAFVHHSLKRSKPIVVGVNRSVTSRDYQARRDNHRFEDKSVHLRLLGPAREATA